MALTTTTQRIFWKTTKSSCAKHVCVSWIIQHFLSYFCMSKIICPSFPTCTVSEISFAKSLKDHQKLFSRSEDFQNVDFWHCSQGNTKRISQICRTRRRSNVKLTIQKGCDDEGKTCICLLPRISSWLVWCIGDPNVSISHTYSPVSDSLRSSILKLYPFSRCNLESLRIMILPAVIMRLDSFQMILDSPGNKQSWHSLQSKSRCKKVTALPLMYSSMTLDTENIYLWNSEKWMPFFGCNIWKVPWISCSLLFDNYWNYPICIFTVQTYHELKYPSSFSCLVAMNNPLSHSSTFDFQIDGVMIILF